MNFFDDDDNEMECTYCGGTDGDLIVSAYDENGDAYLWHHAECECKANQVHSHEAQQITNDSNWFNNHPSA